MKVPVLGKPKGSVGETKLKILAILSHNKSTGDLCYGYNIWKILNERYCSCLGEYGLRNVYHHLHDLQNKKLITIHMSQAVKDTPERQLYHLTEKGMTLQLQFDRYLRPLKTSALSST